MAQGDPAACRVIAWAPHRLVLFAFAAPAIQAGDDWRPGPKRQSLKREASAASPSCRRRTAPLQGEAALSRHSACRLYGFGEDGPKSSQRRAHTLCEERSPDAGPRTGDVHRHSPPPSFVREALDGRQRSQVEHRNSRDVEDVGLGVFVEAVERDADRGSRPEEERARDPVDDDVPVGRDRRAPTRENRRQ